MESPYQELTQFDLAKAIQKANYLAAAKVRYEHPDFTDDQVQMVLSGQLGTASPQSQEVPEPAAAPVQQQPQWTIKAPPPNPRAGTGFIGAPTGESADGEPIGDNKFVPNVRQVTWPKPDAYTIPDKHRITAAEASTVNQLPANVIKQAELTNPPLPTDPSTTNDGSRVGKPFKLTFNPEVADSLKSNYADLLKAGVDPATAQQQAIVATLGKNWTIQPNTVTNKPAETVKHWFGADTINPADISTNSFRIQPGLAPVPIVQAKNVRDKVSLANSLAKQHPDWTKAQILKAVNGT